MKIIMGILEAVFGVVILGFIGLFSIFSIGTIVTKDAVDLFTKMNNEHKNEINEVENE